MQIRAIVLTAVATLVLGATAGCTPLEACGPGQEEYCTKDGECTCGEECEEPSDCEKDQRCKQYRYNPAHGVCIDEGWLARHDAAPTSEK